MDDALFPLLRLLAAVQFSTRANGEELVVCLAEEQAEIADEKAESPIAQSGNLFKDGGEFETRRSYRVRRARLMKIHVVKDPYSINLSQVSLQRGCYCTKRFNSDVDSDTKAEDERG